MIQPDKQLLDEFCNWVKVVTRNGKIRVISDRFNIEQTDGYRFVYYDSELGVKSYLKDLLEN